MNNLEQKERGQLSHKIPCPDCGSSDGNQVYSYDNQPDDSYCFACQTYFPPNDNVTSIRPKQKVKEMNIDYSKLPFRELSDRGIRKDIAELYNVRVALSEADGKTITHHYYPDTKSGEVTGYEVREVATKDFKALGDRKGAVDLWGKNLASKNGSNKLFITEGRCDAMALYQVITDNTPSKYKQYLPSVVSLTRGASSALKDMVNNRDFVEKYNEVILVLDNDEAGNKATKDIIKSFPLFKVANLPLKDANDML